MKRLILNKRVIVDDIFEFFSDEMMSWFYIEEHLPETDDPLPHKITWVSSENENNFIHYVDDHIVNLQFFALDFQESDECEENEKLLIESFDCIGSIKIFEEAERATTDEDKIIAIGRLSLQIVEEFDADIFSLLKKIVLSSNDVVKLASISRLVYVQDSSVVDLFKQLAISANGELAEQIEAVLKFCEDWK